MNSLSWFLYLADVAGNFKTSAPPIVIFGIISGVGLLVMGAFLRCSRYSWTTDDDVAWWESRRAECSRYGRVLLPASIILLMVVNLIPTRNTMYAIAASEVGEQIIRNGRVQGIASDATKALHQWIRRQIDPEQRSPNSGDR